MLGFNLISKVFSHFIIRQALAATRIESEFQAVAPVFTELEHPFAVISQHRFHEFVQFD